MAQAPPPTAEPAGQPAPIRRLLNAWSVTSVLGAAVLLIFIVQNTKDVTFHFLVLSFAWPLWLYTIVVAVFGALVWFGMGVRRRRRRRKQRRADRA